MGREESPISFGEWIKRRRKSLDLTQEDLAQRAGCSVFALRKIESGERRPSKQLAQLLAAALELPEEGTQTFIRVARGELNLEGMGPWRPDSKSIPASAPPALHHLPVQPTPLLGRGHELAAMERIFGERDCRLLTLTGMGGIGKTRLALEFATRQRHLYPAGAHYVPLASIDSAELIIPALAEALEYSFSGPVDPQEQLLDHLSHQASRPMLLLLDNLEHLLPRSSVLVDLVGELLQRFSNIKLLCTSRERLNLRGEWTYELHGLPVPPSEYMERLDDYGAAALFFQCARHIRAGFEATDADKLAIIRMTRLLEGIPLAIELAAVWVSMLSCAEIAREIERNIDFLSSSMRDMPVRHRSLRATFDHSWKLLSDAEKDVLSRLSVFHGGFSREAAGATAGAELSVLASLVSKSLIRRRPDGRYDLHEVVRQYAWSHLDTQQSLDSRDRHCEYYLHWVAAHATALKSAVQQETLLEMAREMDNIRAAWAWGLERQKFALLGGSVRGLGWAFENGGLLWEGIELFEPLVQALGGKEDSPEGQSVLGQALAQQGLLYFRRGQFDEARQRLDRSLSILRSIGGPALMTDPLVYRGVIAHLDGDLDRARALFKEALVCTGTTGDEWFAAYAIFNLGYIDSLMGNYAAGHEQMLNGLAIWRRLGDPQSIALGLNHLSPTLIKLGCFEDAASDLQESLELCEKSGNRWGKGTAYRFLGLVRMAEGDFPEAQSLFRKSLQTFGDYIIGWDIARSSALLGKATMMAGDLTEARTIYLNALQLAIEANSTPLILDALEGLAQFGRESGAYEQAMQLAKFVVNHPISMPETRERANQLMLDVAPQLGAELIRAIEARVAGQSLDSVVDELMRGRSA